MKILPLLDTLQLHRFPGEDILGVGFTTKIGVKPLEEGVEQLVHGNQKLEVWPGFITSIRQHESSHLLCVDV